MHNPVTCRVSGTILASVVSWSKKPDLSGLVTIQYNTIQILLSTPHGGFSGTNINNTDNKKILKNCQ